MVDAPTIDPNAVASVETDDGRVFAGVGVSEESLRETVEAREPESSPEPSTPPETTTASTAATSASDRNPDGTFKKPSRGQRRFDQLTAKSSEAEQRYAAERQRAEQLERRLAALEASRAVPAVQTPPPSPPAPAQTRPKPSDNDVGVKYETYADFAEDLADWKVEQRFQSMNFDALVRSGIEADRASRAQVEYVQSFGTRARSVYPDFDAVLAAADDSIKFPDLKVLLNAPNAEHLVYHAAKNPEFARKLANERDPIKIGYLMASVSGPAVAPPASTAAPVASRAPAPYQPVGSGSKTSTTTIEDAAESGNYEQYKALRAAQRKGSR